jgi:type IV pilus assembly protein PilW
MKRPIISSTRPVVAAGRALHQRGMTLVELMVALLLGLVTTYFISQVFAVAERYKRTATFGSDAQVNGAVALHTLRRHVMSAGYGLISTPSVLGCPISGRYGAGGSTTPVAGATIAPIVITPGASASAPSDALSIMASNKSTFASPVLVKEEHKVDDPKPVMLVVEGSTHGIKANDVILMVPQGGWSASNKCLLLTVKEDTTDPDLTLDRYRIPHVASPSASSWNVATAAEWPAAGYPPKSMVVNFGSSARRMVFSISGETFQVETQLLGGALPVTEALNSGIVLLKALYGRDTDADGVVDLYDTTTPTDNVTWRNVMSVRLAIVARSAQRERDEVTAAEPTWGVGGGTAVAYQAYPGAPTVCAAAATTCDLPLPVAQLTDWKHYRYKVFETAVQVRNLMWSAEEPAP